jgi:uncharacterized protein with PIN domain
MDTLQDTACLAEVSDTPRFLCDEMLVQLGHWLRAAGHDTLIASHRANDRSLVARATLDGRVLLTRDRKLREIRDAAGCAVLLDGEGIHAWACEMHRRFGIDWMARPFSRCLICNTILQPAPDLARARLPHAVRAAVADINHCRQCDKLYWPGGHVRRMVRQLHAWRDGRFGPAPRS